MLIHGILNAMFSIFNWMKKAHRSDVVKVAEKQLEKNRDVIESLRDYDQGKKDIQIADVGRRLRNI